MTSNPFALFKAMIQILLDLYKINEDEELSIYLSDADPFFYENGSSLDPVVFEDFKELYSKSKDKGLDDYDFIVYYLENLDTYYGNILKHFLSIPKDECKHKLESLIRSY